MEAINHFFTSLDYFFNKMILFKTQDTGVTLSHLTVAIVIIFLTMYISRWICNQIRSRLLARFKLDAGVEFLLMRLMHYLIMLVGFYTAITSIGFKMTALVGFFSLLGVGVGFGLQNVASNFISGVILLFERPVKIGDRITVDSVVGDVTQINLRTTTVQTPDNISIIVPNSKLLENKVTNWSYGDHRIRIHVPVGVAYGSDIDLVTKLLLEAAEAHRLVLKTPKAKAMFLSFGDSALDFDLLCWIDDSRDQPDILNDLNRTIDKKFRDHNVEIPFPQRDLHIRTGSLS